MKTDKMLDLFSDIEPELIEKAEKSGAKRIKTRRIIYAGISVAACVCIAATAVIINHNRNGNIKSGATSSVKSVCYSGVANEGKDTGIRFNGDVFWGTADIAPFDESYIGESLAFIEGELTEIKEKSYNYKISSDKFEPNGSLNTGKNSVVYKIKVKKSYYGDLKEGTTVTVEDIVNPASRTFSLKIGKSYVIPLYDAGNEIILESEREKLISGDITRSSKYSTVYQYHPQIEAAKGGYIVSNDWKTLVKATDIKVICDTQTDDFIYYTDKMFFVESKDFNERMKLLCEKIG